MKLTHREKRVLIAALVIALFFVVVRPSYETVREWEYALLFLFAGPLGFYIATDPGRLRAE